MHFQKRKNQKEIAKPNYAIKNLHIIIYWITFAKQILVSFLHTTTYLIDLISIFWIYASIIYIFHCFYSNFAAVFVMVKMNFKVVKSTMSWGRVNIELGKRGGDRHTGRKWVHSRSHGIFSNFKNLGNKPALRIKIFKRNPLAHFI